MITIKNKDGKTATINDNFDISGDYEITSLIYETVNNIYENASPFPKPIELFYSLGEYDGLILEASDALQKQIQLFESDQEGDDETIF